MPRYRLRSAAALALLTASTLPAQSASTPSTARPSAAESRAIALLAPRAPIDASSAGRPVGGALLGGAVGMLAGGVVGAFGGGNRCSDSGNPDSCDVIGGILVGAAVGVTLGAPAGAHLLNRRQGSLPSSLLASTALAVAGVVAIRAANRMDYGPERNRAHVATAIAVPVLQVVSSAVIEHLTSRR